MLLMIESSLPSSIPDEIAEKIFDISIQSARCRSREIYIYELSSLSALIGEARAEIVRSEMLKHNITVYQIANTPVISPFTKNDPFVEKCMNFRYVPKSTMNIETEVLIFDDVVVSYCLGDTPKFQMIQDPSFAQMQRSLFLTLWWESSSPEFAFEYHAPKSYYTSVDMTLAGKHAIVYADRDAWKAYLDRDFSRIEIYLENILQSDDGFAQDGDYFIIFLWSYEGAKMVDIWKYMENPVDTHSGPLSETRTYKEGTICTGLWVGSGSTLLILGYEERIRRQSKNLDTYFSGPAPKLPFEMLIEESFFTE